VVAARGELGLGVEDAVEGGLHVARREAEAVVELHVLAELDLPRGVVHVAPRGGQAGADLTRLQIARGEMVEHVVAEDDALA